MKNKLKFYCSILAVVIIISVVSSISTSFHVKSGRCYSNDEVQGELELGNLPEDFAKIDSIEGGVRTTYFPTFDAEVNVERRFITGSKVLLSHENGNTYKVEMKKVRLSIPWDKVVFSTPQCIIAGASFCIYTPLIIWLLVMVFRVIKSIRKGEVFVSNIAHYLEKLGAWIIAFVFANFGLYCLYVYTAKQMFSLAHYEIVYNCALDTTSIILGLVLMIISQIILMGKELKEEQELTI